MDGVGVGALLSLSWIRREVGRGGRLFEAGRLLTFSAFRIGAYSRWALIRGWALIRINTVYYYCVCTNLNQKRATVEPVFVLIVKVTFLLRRLNKSSTVDSRKLEPSLTRTLANSNLALTRTKIDFPWISVIHLL